MEGPPRSAQNFPLLATLSSPLVARSSPFLLGWSLLLTQQTRRKKEKQKLFSFFFHRTSIHSWCLSRSVFLEILFFRGSWDFSSLEAKNPPFSDGHAMERVPFHTLVLAESAKKRPISKALHTPKSGQASLQKSPFLSSLLKGLENGLSSLCLSPINGLASLRILQISVWKNGTEGDKKGLLHLLAGQLGLEKRAPCSLLSQRNEWAERSVGVF